MSEECECRSNSFVEDLIEVSRRPESKLAKFINDELFPQRSEKSMSYINCNISELGSMEYNQLIILKATAESFEKNTDVSKYLPTLLTILGMVLSMYSVLVEISKNSSGFLFMKFFAIAILSMTALRVYRRTIKMHQTATYFKKLINNIEMKDRK